MLQNNSMWRFVAFTLLLQNSAVIAFVAVPVNDMQLALDAFVRSSGFVQIAFCCWYNNCIKT